MATNFPPDGYSVAGGDSAWGTDVDHDDTAYVTGDSSVVFEDTEPSADPILIDDTYYPCAAGDLFRVGAWFRADSVVAGNRMFAGVNWFTAAKVYDSTSYSFLSVLDAAAVGVNDNWQYTSGVVTAPATAYYFRPLVGKDNTVAPNNFHGWADSLEVVRQPPAFEAVIAGAWVAIDPAVTVVPFDSEVYDYGSNYNNAAASEFTAPVDGTYGLTASAGVVALGVDAAVAMFFQKDTGGGYVNWGPAQTITGPGYNLLAATFYSWLSIAHAGAWLNAGDKIRVMFGNKTGGNLTGVTANGTVFSAAKLE